MNGKFFFSSVFLLVGLFANGGWAAGLQISLKDYEDKLKGGWVGQMYGVMWGLYTEFAYCDRIIPENEVPDKFNVRINWAYLNDDLYNEIPFFQTMHERGITATWHDFGLYFKNHDFSGDKPDNIQLWHTNLAGYTNLNNGIPVPSSGHYSNNPHCDDIGWQIESNFIGLLMPGQPQSAIDIAWRAGHTMIYGDGAYGGVFIAAMHAASFFTDSMTEIVEKGRQSLPPGSQYRQIVDDVITWHSENPDDWEQTWHMIQEKWGDKDRCPIVGGGNPNDPGNPKNCNIDAKVNGAYIVMGLLYGNGDMEKSMRITMRCGQDSDCNPSSVGGIFGSWLGYSKIPEEFKQGLNLYSKFKYSQYSLYAKESSPGVIEASIDLARQIVLYNGGSVQGAGAGEMWHIADQKPILPLILEQWPTSTNAKPQLSASVGRIVGSTVTFSALATDSDGVREYQWFFGDLSYANGAAVSHTYRQGGTYKVICYVTDNIGNTAFQELEVTVSDDPTPPAPPQNLTISRY